MSSSFGNNNSSTFGNNNPLNPNNNANSIQRYDKSNDIRIQKKLQIEQN
jgi:hypothetical protein